MEKKLTAFFAVMVILLFIGYIIFDTVSDKGVSTAQEEPARTIDIPDSWQMIKDFKVPGGKLNTVAVSENGNIYLGGDSFLTCYNNDLKEIWNLKTEHPVTSLCCSGDTIYAATSTLVMVIGTDGKKKNEWGPYEDRSFITSISANKKHVVIADAGNRMLLILDKGGEVTRIIGQNNGEFIIPSPYFEVVISPSDTLFVANTGHRRIEKRTIEGKLVGYFGEPGTGPDAFCGCCNPSHFIMIPGGFITSEKGISRIKLLDDKGSFTEYVTAHNNFVPSVPLDLASADGKTVYAANPSDSKLYVYTRK